MNNLGNKMRRAVIKQDSSDSEQFTERTLMHGRVPDPQTENPSLVGENWDARCCSFGCGL